MFRSCLARVIQCALVAVILLQLRGDGAESSFDLAFELCAIPPIDFDNVSQREAEFRNASNNDSLQNDLHNYAVTIPQLSSKPGAPIKLVLDFNGHPAHTWADFSVTTTPAFDRDGNAGSFLQSEADAMTEIWQRVSESYSPFDIDVTTIDPGTYPINQTIKIIVGGDGDWAPPSGGVAVLNSFGSSSPRWAFCFPKNLGNGEPKFTADCIAHEAGHMFRLRHQARYTGSTLVEDYHTGNGERAPIMGIAYNSERGIWWSGPTDVGGPNTIQNDIPTMLGNSNFVTRGDDHGNTAVNATTLVIEDSAFAETGVIETLSDIDQFSFETDGGTVVVAVDVFSPGSTLNAKLVLKNQSGAILASAAPSNSLSAALSVSVAEGRYFISVSSEGVNPGDLGRYTVSSEIPGDSSTPPGSPTATPTPGGPIATPTPTATPRAPGVVPPTSGTPTPGPTPIPAPGIEIISPTSGAVAAKRVTLVVRAIGPVSRLRISERQTGRQWLLRTPGIAERDISFRYTMQGTRSDLTVRGVVSGRVVSQRSITLRATRRGKRGR